TDVTIDDGMPVTIDLSGNEMDTEDGSGDNNSLIWSISGVDVTLFTASIDPGTDILTITPVLDASGSDVVTLTLTDSGGLTDTQNVTVTITAAVVNDSPVISSVIPDITTSENIPEVFDLTAYETDTEDGPAADDNNLIWSISGVDETLFTASIDSADVLTITPALDASGTDVVTLTLTDSGGKTDSQEIIIAVIGNVGISLVAGGYSHSYVVYEGIVWAWGDNTYGQVGNDSTDDKWSPVSIGFTDVTSLASGGWGHSLSVKSDGTVWAWGDNSRCELGIGDEVLNSLIPVQTLLLENIKTVETGDRHGLALKLDGTVWSWGYNKYGQMGIGSNIPEEVLTPVLVPDLVGIIDIAGGAYHSLAVKSDGTVLAWGYNNDDELGDGTGTDQWSPIPVPDLTDVIAVAAGYSRSLALKSDETVWGWGGDFAEYYELGTGPFQISGFDGIVDIASGDNHMLALKSDGTVWAWGSNDYGNLGDGTDVSVYGLPNQVILLTDVTDIACGHYHSLARKSDGSIWAWGYNNDGAVGIGNESISLQLTPVKVL
ncbi:MAG: hypothetical protein KAQ99_03905, partial [Candidatus Aureabacteria bacterium]|nr:hypothetical protein [Candidatus Auribacterota bacterium]